MIAIDTLSAGRSNAFAGIKLRTAPKINVTFRRPRAAGHYGDKILAEFRKAAASLNDSE